MDAVSNRNPDVDSAGVYFVMVEEFEHRGPTDRDPQQPADERSVITDDGARSATERRPTSTNNPNLRARK
jgi:hypothetical protein